MSIKPVFDFEEASIYPKGDNAGWTITKTGTDRWKVMKVVMIGKRKPYESLVYYVSVDERGVVVGGENGWLMG